MMGRMSDPVTNGQAKPTPKDRRRERRRRLREQRDAQARDQRHAREDVGSIIADETRRLLEHYYHADDDWSTADFWDRTRGDYMRQLPSRPGDRRGGQDWPLWRNEQDLDRIRQKARIVSEVNSYARGFRENYINHVVGKGCQYKIISKEGTPDADPEAPGKQDAAALAAYVASVQDEVDDFLQRNRWNGTVDPRGPLVFTGSREREVVDRTLCDGECFLRFHVVSGHLVVRFLEPEQVRNPPAGIWADGWSFGIKHQVERDDAGGPVGDVETTEAYYVYWIDPSTVATQFSTNDFTGEEIDAGEVLHVKGPNTKSTVKRGVSFFSWDVAASFERARVLQRNASIGAAVRAATAEIWKHHYGTQAEVQTFANIQREYQNERIKADGSTQTENVELAKPGMIRRIPAGQEPVFPAPDNTASYLTGVQGDLQQAVSGKCAPLYWAADTSGGTYAGLKEAGAPAVKMAEAQQTYFTAVFSRVVWKALEVAVEAGRLEDRLDLVDLQVEAPTVLQRDRLQVAQESQILNQLGALSPQTICMEAGRDYELEAANIQRHQDRFGQAGMPLGIPDAQGTLPGLPNTHGMGDDAGGALHGDDALKVPDQHGASNTPTPGPQADAPDPKMAVANLNAIAALQAEFYAGKLPREAVMANMQLLFGFTPEEAASLFPEIAPQKLTPDDAGDGGTLGVGLPKMESLLESTCAPLRERFGDGSAHAVARVALGLLGGKPEPVQPVSAMTVHLPESIAANLPAPVVNVAPAQVTIEAAAPAPAPNVTVHVPEQPAPVVNVLPSPPDDRVIVTEIVRDDKGRAKFTRVWKEPRK